MKNYLGKGKQGKYEIVNFSICLTDVNKEDIQLGNNGKKYLNCSIGQMKEVDKYGNTHTVWLNDFKPEKQEVKQEPSYKNEGIEVNEAGIEQNEDGIPF